MKIAVRIPDTPDSLEQYLEILTGAHIADAVELDGQTVDQTGNWEELLDAYQLTLLSVAGLLPESVSRYIPETDVEYRRKLSEYCKSILKRAAASGALFASFDLGVDRAKVREEDFEVRVKLRLLLPDRRSDCALLRLHQPQGLAVVAPQHVVDVADA